MQAGKIVNGTASPWGADISGYNSDPQHYGHDDVTNTTGTNAYLDGNTNDYGSDGYNRATAGDAPLWLFPLHPTHHWDGLMPFQSWPRPTSVTEMMGFVRFSVITICHPTAVGFRLLSSMLSMGLTNSARL